MPSEQQAFEEAVSAYYQPLFRFAVGLSRNESDAADLTQRAFERFAEKSSTLREKARTKTWLFTTLYRDFLQQKRRTTRFPEFELNETNDTNFLELPRAEIAADANAALAALQALDEPFRSALALFYLEDQSYREIAEILDVPIGTVMSRISRGKEMLRAQMTSQAEETTATAAGKCTKA